MRLLGAWPSIVLALAFAAGCASEEPAKPAPQTEGDEIRQDVLSECRAFGERVCASAGPCCSSHGEFSEADCVQSFVEITCSPAASVVAEGLATYDASREEACFAALEASFAVCEADWEEVVAQREAIWSACKVVQGTREPGETCDTSALCAPPPGAATVACVRGQCEVREFLGEGAECPYPNGDVSLCATGFYCTAMAQGEIGTCVPATPEGGACLPEKLNPECGLGYFCDLEAAVCRKATNFGGPTCDQGTECVSFVCDREARSCLEPPPLAARFCGDPEA
jgi:hypothetical protein